MPDTPVLRLAVLGAAHPHVTYALDELAHRDDLELVAVGDPDPDLAAQYAHPHAARTYTDHHTLLAQEHPDVVVVAGIYGDRAQAVIDALDAGAHVLADKPLCTSLKDLDLIEEAALRSGRTVSLLLEKRHYPETVAARRLMAEGELGTLAMIASTGPHKLNRAGRPDWFWHRRSYGGIIGDLAVHDIDLVLHLSGATEGTVSAVSGPGAGDPAPGARDFPDDLSLYGAVLLTAGNLVATIDVSWLTPAASPWHGDYFMRLTGTRGIAELHWARNQLTVVTDTRAPYSVDLPERRRPGAEALAAFATGGTPEVGTSQSLAATRIALLAQDSADHAGATRRWTTTPEPAAPAQGGTIR